MLVLGMLTPECRNIRFPDLYAGNSWWGPRLPAGPPVQALAQLDCTHTEHPGHIDDANAAQLNEVADILRSGAHDLPVGHLAQLYRIVGHQTVPALDQLNGQLAFADAAVAKDQDAFAVHLHQTPCRVMRGASSRFAR